ncbi:MAG: DUF3999 domain-containing protein [Pseudomonadales bacterium]|jgi:hypothetical protein|nr:DUF3999 domain-containing protein [Pseudomonadales bacterium]
MKKLFFTAWFMIAGAGGAKAQESAALTPLDFASGFSLEGTSPEQPLYSLDLPADVLLGTVWPDLRDIGVFNAQSQSVPFWLRQPSAAPPPMQSAAMKMFALPSQRNQSNQDTIVVSTDRGRVDVSLPFSSSDAAKGAAYLLEVPDLKDYPILARVKFDWQRGAENWRGQVTLSGGDNLTNWYTIASGALVDLKAGDDSLRVDELPLRNNEGFHYYLLQFDTPDAPKLTNASIMYYEQAALPEKLMLDMSAKRISANEYEFSLPHALPVSALRIQLPENNTIASAQLSTRATADEPWRTLGTSALYRLQEYGAAQTQPDIDTFDRVLQTVRIVAQGAGWGEQAPTVAALTTARVLVFNARGNGPFLLAFGARAANEALAFPEQIPGLSGEGAISRLPTALLGAAVKLGGPERLSALSPAERSATWKKALLWLVLLLGAGTLAWFALRLIREVRAGEYQARE